MEGWGGGGGKKYGRNKSEMAYLCNTVVEWTLGTRQSATVWRSLEVDMPIESTESEQRKQELC